MDAAELIGRAVAHLESVGLKKGSWSHSSRECFFKDESPVCGMGALKWVVTGNPKASPSARQGSYRVFVRAWRCMNSAAEEIDPSIPSGVDAFITYNDDPDTSLADVLTSCGVRWN